MSAAPGSGFPDLRARVLGGLGWVVGSQVGLQLTRALAAIAIARLLTPEEYGLAALALVFASLVLVFSDLALGAALIQRKELSRRSTATRPSGSRSPAASSSRSSGSRSPARSRRSTATPTPSRCSQVLSIGVRGQRARRAAAVADAPRHGLPARGDAADDRRARRAPWRAWRSPRRAAAPGRSSSSTRSAATVTTIAVWLRSPWRPRFAFSRDEPARPRRLQRLHARPPDALLPPDQRRPLPHRPLPRHGLAGRLRDRLQHDHPAGEQASAARSSA